MTIKYKTTKFAAVLLFVILSCSFLRADDITAQMSQPAVVPDITTTETTGTIDPIAGGMMGNISLDLKSIDVVEALKFLALKAKINIISTKDVSGRITLTVENVAVKDVFDIMIRSNGLAYVYKNNIYNIMTEAEYKALYGKDFSDLREVKTFRLQYAIPEQAFTLLDTLKSEIGRVLVEPDSGTALIMDTPESIRKIEKSLATLEQNNDIRSFNLQYANAKHVEEQLKIQLEGKKVGTIKADERSNLVIVQALPNRMKEIEELIKALDEKTKQVIIDARIVKVRLSDTMDTGIEWEGLMKTATGLGAAYFGSYPFSAVQAVSDAFRTRSQVLSDLNGDIGSMPMSGYTTDYSTGEEIPPGSMHVGIVDKSKDVDIFLKYLETLGNTKILSNPKVSVINNQEARVHVGERQAYVTTTTTAGQSTTTVSEEVTFVDVGIQLHVTPTINDDGYITMNIRPEISSVTSYLITPTNNKIPIIDTSTTETTVLVKDGATIVLGGLRREDETEDTEQVPYLGDIPLLGKLFKNEGKTTVRTELMIMITPHIVDGDRLTTGDERDFGLEETKEYEDYDSIKPEDVLDEEENIISTNKLKPYRKYGSVKKESGENE